MSILQEGETLFSFTNPRGETLVGTFSDAGPGSEVALLCHGYLGNQRMCNFPALAAALRSAGVSSYRFDHALAHSSESERKGEFRVCNHSEEVEDAMAAKRAVEARFGRTVTGLVGHSKGGYNAFLGASSRPGEVARIVCLSGRFKMLEGLESRYGPGILDRLLEAKNSGDPDGSGGLPAVHSWGTWTMRYDDFRARADIDVPAEAARVPSDGSVRILFLHGRDDETVSPSDSTWASSLVPASSFRLIPGNHNFTSAEAREAMIGAIVPFLAKGEVIDGLPFPGELPGTPG